MLAVIILVLGGYFYVAEQPICRNEASSFVDPRCEVLARDVRRD